MNKRNKKSAYWLTGFACICMVVTVVLCLFLIEKKKQEYSIDMPYVFRVTPGTDEWNQLKTRAERVRACSIDEEILNKMTTRALLETVIHYPFLVDMYAYNTIEDGIDHVAKEFSGLRILLEREDALSVINDYIQTEESNAAEERTFELNAAGQIARYIADTEEIPLKSP